MSKKIKILFTGGGTGGHVYPIIAIIREMIRIYPQNNELEFFYMGAKDEFSLISFSQEGIRAKGIVCGKLRRYFSLQNILDIFFKVPFGILQSLYYLIRVRPELIFSKGGYGAIPVTIAGRILRIPVFIHESDIVPGIANRIMAKRSEKIFISFPRTEYLSLEKTIFTGNPIRKEVVGGSKLKAQELFNLNTQKPIIFFIGGSQGAEKINNFVLNTLNKILKNFEIIHQTGPNNFKQVESEANSIIDKELISYYHPFPLLDQERIKHAYEASDLIISRAGSGSIFEIAANKKPSILIPLSSSSGDHQSKNAYFYSQKGACLIIEEKNLTSNFFLEKLDYLFFYKPEELERMKKNAREFSEPLAAKKIARHVIEYLVL